MRLHKTVGHPKHWMRLFIAFLFSAAIVSAAPTLTSATVVGDLQTGSAGTFTFSLGSLTWNTDPSSTPPGPPWNSEVVTGTHLTFAGCPSGVLGVPGCLDAAPFTPAEGILVANGNSVTLGAGFGPNNPFFQFAGNGITHATIQYTIATLGPGSSNAICAGLSIGQSCSIFAGSPLILTDTAAGTTVSLAGGGTATDGSGSSRWLGEFSVPIAGMTPSRSKLSSARAAPARRWTLAPAGPSAVRIQATSSRGPMFQSPVL